MAGGLFFRQRAFVASGGKSACAHKAPVAQQSVPVGRPVPEFLCQLFFARLESKCNDVTI
jgi:hypothetical protein